jgi:hypothetical protein
MILFSSDEYDEFYRNFKALIEELVKVISFIFTFTNVIPD